MSRVLGMIERRAEDQSADIILKYVLRRDGVKHAAAPLVDTWKWKSSRTLTRLSERSEVLAGSSPRCITIPSSMNDIQSFKYISYLEGSNIH